MILAGAGSGKTRVLVSRAAYILHNQLARPYQILALTFTNKSAGELKLRIRSMVGAEGDFVLAGTFHSLFARILRQEGMNIGLDPNYTIIDSDDQRKLIRTIIKELGLIGSEIRPAAVAWRISKAKNLLISPDDYRNHTVDLLDQSVAKVYKVYQKRLRKMSGLDFDDLLIRPLEAFQEYPEFLTRLQNRFQYVMVDEYQDTNRVQYRLVQAIAKGQGNICVVGDDDQAIYSWRGATVRNILDFKHDWPEAKVISLEQNYRSTQPILDAAWSVIKHNSERHPKKLWTDRKHGEQVELIGASSDENEGLKFAGAIADLNQTKQIPFSQFAILYRTNAQSLPFERALRAAQLPYRVVGGLKFYERKEVKDILAYLRLVINPVDDISCQRIINYPPRAIGKELQENILATSRIRDCSLIQAVENISQDPSLSSRRVKSLRSFQNLIAHFKKFLSENPFPMLAHEIVAALGLDERLKIEEKGDPTRADAKRENVRLLLEEIDRYAETTPKATLSGFLEEVALITDVDDLNIEEEKVNLMTMHSSKGLEFSVVLIGGVEESVLPLKPRDGETEDIQEERRLFYVGMTRAKDTVILGCASSRMRWGQLQWNTPSRFLREIPDELIDGSKYVLQSRIQTPFSSGMQSTIDLKKTVTTKRASKQASNAKGSLDPDDLTRGLLVEHAKFGLGIVTKFTNLGLDSRIQVDFDDVGSKKLILKYARLTIVRR